MQKSHLLKWKIHRVGNFCNVTSISQTIYIINKFNKMLCLTVDLNLDTLAGIRSVYVYEFNSYHTLLIYNPLPKNINCIEDSLDFKYNLFYFY